MQFVIMRPEVNLAKRLSKSFVWDWWAGNKKLFAIVWEHQGGVENVQKKRNQPKFLGCCVLYVFKRAPWAPKMGKKAFPGWLRPDLQALLILMCSYSKIPWWGTGSTEVHCNKSQVFRLTISVACADGDKKIVFKLFFWLLQVQKRKKLISEHQMKTGKESKTDESPWEGETFLHHSFPDCSNNVLLLSIGPVASCACQLHESLPWQNGLSNG